MAQWTFTGESGVSHLKQPGLPEGNVFTFGGSAERSTDRAFLRSSALTARTGDNRWTAQGLTAATVATPAWRSWVVQGTGSASLFGQTNLRPTTSGDGLLQFRGGNDLRGIAFGGGIGATSHNAVWIAESRGVGDAWWTVGENRLGVEATVTRTPSVFGESSILVDISNVNVNYLDLAAQWRHERGGWSFSATSGVRGRNGLSGAAGWQSVEAAAWVTRNTAIVMGAGHTLEDLVRGVPKASYASIALRFSSDEHPRAFRRRVVTGPTISVVRADSALRIQIVAGRASRVELMADFTGWNAVALERAGAMWVLDRAIAPGLHRVAIRIDGGEWIVPANLPRVEDDLGAAVGLITVP